MIVPGLNIKNLTGFEIASTGHAFPTDGGSHVSNTDIHKLVFGNNWEAIFSEKKYDADFIQNNLGYLKRYWTHIPGTANKRDELNSADLMEQAALQALKKTNIPSRDIDLLIAVTVTSPKYTNSMGSYIAGKLGLQCPALEIKTGCASAIYALVLAAQFIENGARNVLITAAETPSKVTGIDGNLVYAVGDGGAAVILSKTGNTAKGIVSAFLGTEGKYSGTMGTPGILPPNKEDIENNGYTMLMGKESEEFIQQAWTSVPAILYENSGLKPNDIDLLIPHQVNKKIMRLVRDAADIPIEKTSDLIEKYANCASASILIALDHAVENNIFQKNNSIMLAAVGGGVSYGGLILNT